ncbi:MAG: hypothetical protein ACOYNF_16560 [Rhodoferax sp.]
MSKSSITTEHGELSTALRVSSDPQPLYVELRALITSSRQRLDGAVTSLRRRQQFAVAFPNTKKVASLMRQLSGVQIVPTPSRQFPKADKLQRAFTLSLQILSTLLTILIDPFLT